ncbi:MAG TPA: GNAT family protein [Pyrinomonadaceae bacterium]|jgi:RimJ/RimL family protein N-acetyltransferase
MSLRLRPTTEKDLPFVVRIESEAAATRFVSSQTRGEHEDYLADSNVRHLIIENEEKPIGYVILLGLNDANENVEFRRVVIAEKGKGYGRQAVRLIKKIAFAELNAHRLWLDVKDFNTRARRLYETEGFVAEGVWRECEKNGDARESLVFMSILRSEFENE